MRSKVPVERQCYEAPVAFRSHPHPPLAQQTNAIEFLLGLSMMKNLVAAHPYSHALFRRTAAVATTTWSSSPVQWMSTLPYPRAAVAVTVQSKKTVIASGGGISHSYLLVQRANPPDQGKWSLPGGKIQVGEPTLVAAQRELYEETGLSSCQWYEHPFLTTDAITYHTTTTNPTNPTTTTTQVQFHYLIAQCFARAADGLPSVIPNDDALDAQWFTVSQLQTMQKEKTISEFVVQVVERAEELSLNGLLLL